MRGKKRRQKSNLVKRVGKKKEKTNESLTQKFSQQQQFHID
jgi:hypothetical protein